MCRTTNCTTTGSHGNQQLSNLIKDIFKRRPRRDPTDSILLGSLVGLLIFCWILYLNREYLKAKFSYLKIMLSDFCFCDDLDEALEVDCEGIEDDMRDISRRKIFSVKTPSPPPPYEHPPSYSIAISNELEHLYSHVIS